MTMIGAKRRNGKTMRTVDTGSTKLRRGDSIPAQLEALKVDESFSRSCRIPIDDFAQAGAKEWMDKVQNSLSVQVARVKEANPKREYTIERLSGLANTSPNILCSVIVTRTA